VIAHARPTPQEQTRFPDESTWRADEPLFVYADPAGHPFCIFVA
jgi:hypothetical protein